MNGGFKFYWICFVIFGCVNHQKLNPPEKPKGVPEKAFWVGGADGGSFYLIEQIDSTNKSAVIKVYNDYTGDLIEGKLFHLHCDSAEKINWENLELDIDSFDGQRIFLNRINKNSKYCYLE